MSGKRSNRLARSLGIEDRVEFLGWVDHFDVPRVFAQVACFGAAIENNHALERAVRPGVD